MTLKQQFRNVLRKLGYDVVRFSPKTHAIARRKQLLQANDINLILDVGADVGQFAEEVRAFGYSGRIISFEPREAAYALLRERARAGTRWDAICCALGSSVGSHTINVAGNASSSSLLQMLPAHIQSAPESRYTGAEVVEVRTLDSLMSELCAPDDRIYLKIDAQGYEREVLRGADSSLAIIQIIQVELSLVPLYEGQALFLDIHELLAAKGYRLVSIEPGFADETTGQLLQFDGLYRRG